MTKTTASRLSAMFAASLLYVACATETGPSVHGGETNWFTVCRTNDDCTGSAVCACGVCTRVCSASSECRAVTDGTCALRATPSFDVACSDNGSIHGACFQRCPAEGCSGSLGCIDGLCVPNGLRDASTGAGPGSGANAGGAPQPDAGSSDAKARGAGQVDAGRSQDSRARPVDGSTTADSGAPLEPGCFEVRAHGTQGLPDDSSYAVKAGEYIHSFYFDVPYTNSVQGARFEALVDGPEVGIVQHIWLFESTKVRGADGAHSDTIGLHLSEDLLYAWAPGLGRFDLPPDVGAYLPNPGGQLEMEILYTNPGAMTTDRSGVRFCTTPPRTHQAMITVLGTEDISIEPGTTGEATGTCAPSGASGEDIHLVASMPHMHRTGRAMRSTIERAAGGVEVVLDTPFDFAHHRIYETSQIVKPEDRLVTRCSYDNDTTYRMIYQPSSIFEHCYDFVYAYPPGALVGSPGILGAVNMCMR